MTRVLAVSNGFPPRGKWGTEFYTKELTLGLKARGHDVAVFHPVRNGEEPRYTLEEDEVRGVPVYLIYDWFGCWATPRSFWKPFRKAGVHLAAFNPPTVAFGNPFSALQRDHRKLVVVDGEVAYLGGMCVGSEWAGTPTKAPWRA